MTTDIVIQALREAFENAVNAAVDVRMAAVLQNYANATAQFATDIDALKQRGAAPAENDEFWVRMSGFVEREVLANFAVADVIGHDTHMELKNQVAALSAELDALKLRIAALDLPNRVMTESKVKMIVSNAIDDHKNEYDHDSYDEVANDFDSRVESEVRNLFRNARLSVDF